MSEDTNDIIVTGKKLSVNSPAAGGSGSAGTATLVSFTQQPLPDVFDQDGGDETITTTSFALIDGNVVVRLPGYDFPIKIPAATWERMSAAQKGAFVKLMTEFSQSAHFVEFLDHLQA